MLLLDMKCYMLSGVNGISYGYSGYSYSSHVASGPILFIYVSFNGVLSNGPLEISQFSFIMATHYSFVQL